MQTNIAVKGTQLSRSKEAQHLVSLTVDEQDTIIDVSSSWDSVAKSGGAGESLFAKRILGQALADFIKSDNTTMYIATVIKLCRLQKKTLFREYRCDSPTHKRFMEMELQPLEEGFVKINHYLLREEPLETPLHLQDITPDLLNTSPALLRCSMCNRLKKPGEAVWLPAEQFSATEEKPLRVIHTVCRDCLVAIWQFGDLEMK